jgi:hypothetical protein
MDLYNQIISSENNLFYDCFARNKELILLSPLQNKFKIFYDENDLKIIKQFTVNSVYIYVYNLPVNKNTIVNINIQYENYLKNLELFHVIIPNTEELYISTSFKNEIYLLPTWLNHYKNLGFNKFIIYVKHPLHLLNKLIEKVKQINTNINFNEDVLFLEWNLNIDCYQHCFLKYGKLLASYFSYLYLNQFISLNDNYHLNIYGDNHIAFKNYNCLSLDKPLFKIYNINENDIIENQNSTNIYLIKTDKLEVLSFNNIESLNNIERSDNKMVNYINWIK